MRQVLHLLLGFLVYEQEETFLSAHEKALQPSF